jgi:hypothetical protein
VWGYFDIVGFLCFGYGSCALGKCRTAVPPNSVGSSVLPESCDQFPCHDDGCLTSLARICTYLCLTSQPEIP